MFQIIRIIEEVPALAGVLLCHPCAMANKLDKDCGITLRNY